MRASAVTVMRNCRLSPVECGQLNLTLLPIDVGSLKANVENPRGSVEKLYPKESYSTLPQGFSISAWTTKIMRFTGK